MIKTSPLLAWPVSRGEALFVPSVVSTGTDVDWHRFRAMPISTNTEFDWH
jgi:hypothetical protein